MAQAMFQARQLGRVMEMAGLPPAIGQSATQVVWAVSHAPAAATQTRIQSPGVIRGRDQLASGRCRAPLNSAPFRARCHALGCMSGKCCGHGACRTQRLCRADDSRAGHQRGGGIPHGGAARSRPAVAAGRQWRGADPGVGLEPGAPGPDGRGPRRRGRPGDAASGRHQRPVGPVCLAGHWPESRLGAAARP